MKKTKIEETRNLAGNVTTRDEQLHNLGNSLYDKRSSSSDVTLECNGGIVKAHRVVLTSSCNYFDALFDSNLEESKTGKINFPEINADVMETILKFLYTGLMDGVSRDVDHLKQVTTVAHMMQITTLLQRTSELLIPLINGDNYTEFWDLASACDQKEMVNSIVEIIQKNFAKFEANRDYDQLSFEQMCDLLSNPSIEIICSVERKIKMVLQWVGHESDERLKVLADLLKLFNLERASKKCLYELSNDQRILSTPEILPTLFSITAKQLYKTNDNPVLAVPFQYYYYCPTCGR